MIYFIKQFLIESTQISGYVNMWHKCTSLTLCILMDFPIHIATVNKGLPIVFFKGLQVEFLNNDVLLSLKVVLILANRADPDEMQHYAAFHLGFHCLPKYQFRSFQYTKESIYGCEALTLCPPFTAIVCSLICWCTLVAYIHHHIIIRFLINVQVHHPHQWPPFQVTG